MFAVPGWSLGAEKPKILNEDASKAQSIRSSKKRKRKAGFEDVSTSNVAELWQMHVDGETTRPKDVRSPKVEENRASKQRRRDKTAKARSHEELAASEAAHAKHVNRSSKANDVGEKLDQRAIKAQKLNSAKIIKDDLSTASTPKLTPMQSAMRLKLLGARFRHLNESLYTSPSEDASALFASNPTFFDEYHEGFRQQVSTWPENPVDQFVKLLKQRSKLIPSKTADLAKRKHSDNAPAEKAIDSRLLPQRKGSCKVADIGCGDAQIAKQLKGSKFKTKLDIVSFDLFSSDPMITKADAANLPLPAGSVDVAILCLALMGTNWIEFIEEAWRVLSWKGELWIAEIKSRFGRPKKKAVDHSVGKRSKKPSKIDKQKLQREEDEAATQKLIAEVDGSENLDNATDVSTFQGVLLARGFSPDSVAPVDLSNKMFVKMIFVKNATPVRGKHVEERSNTKVWREMLRESDADDAREAAALKPCLYKTR